MKGTTLLEFKKSSASCPSEKKINSFGYFNFWKTSFKKSRSSASSSIIITGPFLFKPLSFCKFIESQRNAVFALSLNNFKIWWSLRWFFCPWIYIKWKRSNFVLPNFATCVTKGWRTTRSLALKKDNYYATQTIFRGQKYTLLKADLYRGNSLFQMPRSLFQMPRKIKGSTFGWYLKSSFIWSL